MWTLNPGSGGPEAFRQILSDVRYPEEDTQHLRQFLAFWFSDETAFSASSSGSTGTPQSIRLNRDEIVASARASLAFFSLSPETDGLVLALSPRHVGGFMVLVRAILGRLPLLILPPSLDPFPPEGLPNEKKWFVPLVPVQLSRLMEDPGFPDKTQNWKGILLGGAALPEALAEKLKTLPCPVFESYGMTETISHIAIRQRNPEAMEPGFQPLPQVRIGVDEAGCLWTEGPMTGFRRIQTHDKVELLPSGRFDFRGRANRTVNSGGLKIQPEEVLSRIRDWVPDPGTEMEALGLPHPGLGEELVLVEIDSPQARSRDWDRILSQITDPKDRRQFPRKVFLLPAWPRTPSLKVDYPAIKAQLAGQNPIWIRKSTV